MNKYNEDFDAIIFECIDRALSTIGPTQRDFILSELKIQYNVTFKNVGKDPSKVEAAIKRLLGPSVASFVVIHALDNIAVAFKITLQRDSTLTQAVELAKKSVNP